MNFSSERADLGKLSFCLSIKTLMFDLSIKTLDHVHVSRLGILVSLRPIFLCNFQFLVCDVHVCVPLFV